MIRIKILNWEKYNGRKDVQHPTWFRIDNNLSTSQSLFGLEPAERWVFIALCGLICSKAPIDGEITVEKLEWLAWYACAPIDVILSALEKLGANGVITYVDERVRTDTFVDVTRQTDRQTDKQICANELAEPDSTVTNPSSAPSAPRFDFESLYELYPRKLGKKQGIEKAKRQVKTPEQFDNLKRAVRRYAAYCASMKLEASYIRYFSSFMTSWEDWIDEGAGGVTTPPSRTQLDDLLA